MRSFAYFIREALKNSKKNFSTTLGAVVTIFLSLLVIGVFMIVSIIVNNMVNTLKEEVEIEIFISDTAAQTDIDNLQAYVDSMSEVESVHFMSKEDALIKFKEDVKNQAIADQMDGNPLPASLQVSLTDVEQTEAVAQSIQAHESYLRVIDSPQDPTSSIKYGEDYLPDLLAFSNMVNIVSLSLVLLLVFVALIFINNTIRLAIMARRKEIAIMRLVGASNGFIRGPFLMEGALQALIGAGLAIGTISLGANYLFKDGQSIGNILETDVAQEYLWLIYIILLAVGVVIGLFGSIWAMRRYLKV